MNWIEVWYYVNLSIIKLYKGVPNNLYVLLLITTVVGLMLIASLKSIKQKGKVIGGFLLVEFILLIYCSTVFFRPIHDTPEVNLKLFWSYDAFFEGKNYVMAEKIMNTIMFVPVGVLLGCAFRSMTWWKVLLIGCGMSVMIEAMQYFFQRGVAEVDDVMHNVTGCLVGYGIYSLVRYGYERIGKRSVDVG